MKIGELSSLAGCSVPAVRFYEAEGLLQAPLRAANNYRQYGQQHVDRLPFIVRCRSRDMSHDDIRALLQLQDDPAMSCNCSRARISSCDMSSERHRTMKANLSTCCWPYCR